MVELENKKCLLFWIFFEFFALLHFILTNILYLTHFYVFFVNLLKNVNFSDFKPSPTCDESSV